MKLSDFVEVTEIKKGWSADKKYCVKDETGKKYMLRLSENEQYDRKKAEFERMQKVQALGVSMCEPIEFGTCEEGVYMVQSWIEGWETFSIAKWAEKSTDDVSAWRFS